MADKRAFVTGASRGIGKAIALALAEAGFDVAISARTIHSGETRDNSLSVFRTDTRALPGSLEETAHEIEACGVRALMAPADLTDRASVHASADAVLAAWGGIDLLVNNGRYVGPGVMDTFLNTPIDAYGKFFEAHCIAPIILTHAFLPGMLERGAGQIITVTSGAAYTPPRAPADKGGFGLGYAVGKASGHVLVGTLHVEFHDRGINAFNVQPGFVATERNAMALPEYGQQLTGAAPPAAIGKTVAWLVTTPEGAAFAGKSVEAQAVCRERNLYPAWT